ncbi:MAG: PH domain-containing protein, partial [Phycisphaeraceae bacterium]|nr:PH domain-containing protein [Phycisphaeraceae bacterium]
QVFEAPLKQIQHTDTVFSLRERFLGLGSIAFSTAGTGSIDAVWRMVAQPLDVHQRVVHALNRYR